MGSDAAVPVYRDDVPAGVAVGGVPATVARPLDYEVGIVGGGPAGLSAAAFCGRMFLKTAVFEGESWGGILTRYCPDKRIDNYPGAPKGILAARLAEFLVEGARDAGADLIGRTVEEVTPEGGIRAKGCEAACKVVILACGSTAAESNVPGERDLAGRGVHYAIRDPAMFRGMRVVVTGGGDTAVSHARRLAGAAGRVTLVHRRAILRSRLCAPGELETVRNLEVLLGTAVERLLGSSRLEAVRVRDIVRGTVRDLPADAVVVATGRVPNSVLLRDLGLALDPGGGIATDAWQRTGLPGILAIGDVSSRLKMIITAVAQAAAAAHEAYAEIRPPYPSG